MHFLCDNQLFNAFFTSNDPNAWKYCIFLKNISNKLLGTNSCLVSQSLYRIYIFLLKIMYDPHN